MKEGAHRGAGGVVAARDGGLGRKERRRGGEEERSRWS